MNKVKEAQIKAMSDAGFETEKIMKELKVKGTDIIKVLAADLGEIPDMKEMPKKRAKKTTKKATGEKKEASKFPTDTQTLVELRSIADSTERIAEALESIKEVLAYKKRKGWFKK